MRKLFLLLNSLQQQTFYLVLFFNFYHFLCESRGSGSRLVQPPENSPNSRVPSVRPRLPPPSSHGALRSSAVIFTRSPPREFLPFINHFRYHFIILSSIYLPIPLQPSIVPQTHSSNSPPPTMSSGVVRSTALRAGGACVRCRKGKTKCVYENGRAPCKNCAKGMHDCYLPSESMAHHHGQSPARHANPHRPPRDSLPAAGPGVVAEARQPVVGSSAARHVQTGSDKYAVHFHCCLLFLSYFFCRCYSPTAISPHSDLITALTVARQHKQPRQMRHLPVVLSNCSS